MTTAEQYVLQQKQEEVRRRWNASRDRLLTLRITERRALDPKDTSMPPEIAEEIEWPDPDVNSDDIKLVGLTEADLVKGRLKVLKRQCEEVARLTALHRDYLERPHEWGGMKPGGIPIDADEEETIVRSSAHSLAVLEEEIEDLKSRVGAVNTDVGGTKSESED